MVFFITKCLICFFDRAMRFRPGCWIDIHRNISWQNFGFSFLKHLTIIFHLDFLIFSEENSYFDEKNGTPCFPHAGTPYPGTPAPRFPPSPFDEVNIKYFAFAQNVLLNGSHIFEWIVCLESPYFRRVNKFTFLHLHPSNRTFYDLLNFS